MQLHASHCQRLTAWLDLPDLFSRERPLPVRKVPKSHVSVTGLHATSKSDSAAEFESLLENDYLIHLDFDPWVESYEVQPVRVPVEGVPRGYVPDTLVHFCPGPDGQTRPSELTEVKSLEDLQDNKAKYAPKFAAATAYALERGWVFVCKTERDIRTPRLRNLKFLRAYRRTEPPAADLAAVLDALAALGGQASSEQLLDSLAATDEARAEILPTLWHLVATRRIAADWDVVFGADVPLWLPEEIL